MMYYALNDAQVHAMGYRGVLHMEYELIKFDQFGELQ